MSIHPRAYQHEQDLAAMHAILRAGQRAGAPAHYPHVGEVDWWLFYLNQEDDRRQTIYLWESSEDNAVVGWTWFSPGFVSFAVYVHPTLLGSQEATQIWLWSEEAMAGGMRAQGEPQICTTGVAEHDSWLQTHLTERGFLCDDSTLLYLARTLVDDLPEPCLPPGYQVRPVAGEWEAEARAAPAHAAFGSQTPFSYYWPRYRNFMRAPVYPSALDLAIEVPNGRLVAFCLCWLNTINQVGHVESVGVHPDFQRRGLGRAVVQAGLRLLQAGGMNVATVCTVLDDPTANQLYKGVGFCPVDQLYTYTLSLI